MFYVYLIRYENLDKCGKWIDYNICIIKMVMGLVCNWLLCKERLIIRVF